MAFRHYPEPSDGTPAFHEIDITDPNPEVGQVVGSVYRLHDDLLALGGSSPTNAADLTTRANERATRWYAAARGRDPDLLAFDGIPPDLDDLLGTHWAELLLADRGSGITGEVEVDPRSNRSRRWEPSSLRSVSASTSLTVQEDGGSPSFSGITTLIISPDNAVVVSNPSTGEAKILLSNASATNPGIVSIDTQEIEGEKTFRDKLTAGSEVTDNVTLETPFASFTHKVGSSDAWGSQLRCPQILSGFAAGYSGGANQVNDFSNIGVHSPLYSFGDVGTGSTVLVRTDTSFPISGGGTPTMRIKRVDTKAPNPDQTNSTPTTYHEEETLLGFAGLEWRDESGATGGQYNNCGVYAYPKASTGFQMRFGNQSGSGTKRWTHYIDLQDEGLMLYSETGLSGSPRYGVDSDWGITDSDLGGLDVSGGIIIGGSPDVGGQVDSVVGGTGVTVDSTETINHTEDITDRGDATTQLTDLGVTTAKIANDAVTNAKIADDAVDTDQLADDAVTAAKIEDGAALKDGDTFDGGTW